MSLPRVLLVGNFLSSHVATKTVGEDLAERLTAHGWQVDVTSSKLPRLTRLLDMQRTIWGKGPFMAAQVDVYSGAAFLWAEAACWSLRQRRTPYVLTLHGGKLPEFAQRWPSRVRRLLASAHTVTTPSAYLRRAMAPYRDELLLLPNALELAAYPYSQRERLRPKLVWLRAFHQIYNPQMVPRVLAELRASWPDATLTMIGPDKGDGSLERTRQQAEELAVESAISYTGGVDKSEVPALLAGHDIFLNTSNADNAPVSVTEAMACGLCVVSTDVGGIRDLLNDGTDALLVPPDDAPAMAAAVARLLSEPQLAESLSRHGRERAGAHDASRVLPQWENLLLSAAGTSSP